MGGGFSFLSCFADDSRDENHLEIVDAFFTLVGSAKTARNVFGEFRQNM